MPQVTKFKRAWLSRRDDNGDELNLWLKQGSKETTFQCTLCKTSDLDCANQEYSAIYQHMNTKNHKANKNSLKDNSLLAIRTLKPQTVSIANDNNSGILVIDNSQKSTLLPFNDQITKAEIVWALTVARRGFTYNSCDGIGEVFKSMFPDSKIAQQFNMQSKKISYVMSHGIGPYFHRELVKKIKSREKFVLCIDEQTNNQSKKQLDLLVKFWSNDDGLVVTRYYKSILLGHAQASVLQSAICDAFKTDGINLKRLLMLGRDNPSVNITLENLIDQKLKKLGSGLLFLGSCNLHVVHNGFKAGLSSTSWYVENVCTDIYSWFKQSPARKEDLADVINDFGDVVEKTLLYFTITRWVLLGKVISRVLELWDPLNEYFLNFLPRIQKSQLNKNEKYEKIKSNLTSNVVKIRLQFVLFLCENIFDRFLTWFQQEEPLIHLLYRELSELFYLVLAQFLKYDFIVGKSGGDLCDIDFKLNEKQLNSKNIRIGERTRKQLNALTQQEREDFFKDIRNIYHGISKYFKLNLPLKNSFIRDLQILHPSMKNAQDVDQIIRVARGVPDLLIDNEIDYLRNEWLAYCIEVIDPKWIIKNKQTDSSGHEHITYHRIDFYWNNIFEITTTNGRPKYPVLTKLIKNILIISHGNADVERGFSINENIISSNRSLLSQLSINSLRTTHDTVKNSNGGYSHNVPIHKELIKAAQSSFSFYNEELSIIKVAEERIRKEKEEKENASKIYQEVLKQEEELLMTQKDLQKQQQEANSIIADGSARLQLAIKKKDSLDIERATILIDGGNNKSKIIGEQLLKVTEDLIDIQKKRKSTFNKQQVMKKLKTTVDSNTSVK
ncbi:unnamed protein product [Rotaria magnacalcarata]